MSEYRYVNSRGNEIDLCASPLWVASFNTLRSYGYEAVYQNDVYFGHERSKNVEKPLKFQYYAPGREAFREYYEQHVYRVINYDIASKAYGRLYVGEYFAIGNFPRATIETYDKIRRMWTAEMPFFMPEEKWTRKVGDYVFTPDQDVGTVPEIPLANYPSNYPHGYVSGNLTGTLDNDSAFPAPFALTIYGECNNPTVTMAGHVYNVDVHVQPGCRLVIDSTDKSITLYDAMNNATNVFARQNHDPDKYIFEPIPAGTFSVSYQNIPQLMLTLYDERSAPRWI